MELNLTATYSEVPGTAHDSDAVLDQLKMAGQVQRDFLPANLPNSAKLTWATMYKPAEWVSGDIYDVARLDEHHIGFYIADAVGHSIPAALLTMFINQAIVMRETIGNKYRIFEPVEVIENLNKRMCRQKLSGCQFVTCCYCLLDTDSMKLTFCRAGHPYPVLVRGDGSAHQLESRGPLLGVFEDAQYFQESIQLLAKDKLLLYSDGTEPFIGKVDETAQFVYAAAFDAVRSMNLQEAIASLEKNIASTKLSPAQIDDITILGLEIS